ncbi:MAG: PEP-CTERM sorting domain-containing protein [Verrucomicrobiota bacterium]
MKSVRPVHALFLFCAAAPLCAERASAVTLLSVDFGRDDTVGVGLVATTGTLLEPGFQGFYMSGAATFTGTASQVYTGINATYSTGSVTVAIQGESTGAAGNMGGRDRGSPTDSGAFTYGDLFRDGIARTKQTSTAGQFTVKLSGLLPLSSYSLTLWSANSTADVNTVYSWYDTSIGSTLLGTVTNGPANPLTATANTDYSITANVQANASGEVLLGVMSGNLSPTAGFINGFQLNSAVPEPSSALMLGGLALAAGFRRRRA